MKNLNRQGRDQKNKQKQRTRNSRSFRKYSKKHSSKFPQATFSIFKNIGDKTLFIEKEQVDFQKNI